MVKTELRYKMYDQIAVSSKYICYALKAGSVRAINKLSAARALFKGHAATVTDLRFAGYSSPLLASCDESGAIFVRRLSDGEDSIHEEVLASFSLAAASNAAVRRLLWHPHDHTLLAVVTNTTVTLCRIPAAAGISQAAVSRAESPALSTSPLTTLAYNAQGTLLAVGDTTGQVSVYAFPGAPQAAAVEQLAAAALGAAPAARFDATDGPTAASLLAFAPGPGCRLLIGDTTNATIKLWALGDQPGASPSPRCCHTLELQNSGGGDDGGVFNVAALQPGAGLLVLANTRASHVYVAHLAADGFDYVARFPVKQPVLSMTTTVEAPPGGGDGDAAADAAGAGSGEPGGTVHLYTIQTEAIQSYAIDPAVCTPTAEEVAAALAAESSEAAAAPSTPQVAQTVHVAPAAPLPRVHSPLPVPDVTPLLAEHLLGRGASGAPLSPSASASSPTPQAPPPQPHKLLTPSSLKQEVKTNGPSAAMAAEVETPLRGSVRASSVGTGGASEAGDATTADAEPLPPRGTPSTRAAAAAAVGGSGASEEVLSQLASLMAMQRALMDQMVSGQREAAKAAAAAAADQAKASQVAIVKAVEAALAAQGRKAEEEARKRTAQHSKEVSDAAAAVSTRVVAEVGRQLQDTARSLVSSVVSSVGPIVKQALAEALPQQLATPQLQQALERALGSQLQASLPQQLSAGLRSSFEASVIPSFERATQAMFGQIDGAFRAGLSEQVAAASGSAREVATTLRDAATKAQAAAGTLSGEVAEAQRRLVSQAAALSSSAAAAMAGGAGGVTAGAAGGISRQGSVVSPPPQPQPPVDPRIAITDCLRAGDYEGAFKRALDLQDVPTVVWLCRQLNAKKLLSADPLPLSQMVLLSLIMQLGFDLQQDTDVKLVWLLEAAPNLDPRDPAVARHRLDVLPGVRSNLTALLASSSGETAKTCKLGVHLINSLMM